MLCKSFFKQTKSHPRNFASQQRRRFIVDLLKSQNWLLRPTTLGFL
jgi:hypothetical protein